MEATETKLLDFLRKSTQATPAVLAVLDLAHCGFITTPFIAVTADLIELNKIGS